MKKKNIRGFSLIETIVTTAVFMMIMGGVYMMIMHYGDSTKTEQSRIRLYQEGRFMMSAFAQEIVDAGAGFSLRRGQLSFNGIYPLNSYVIDEKDSWPDGIILAVGDPHAATVLESDFTPTDGILAVEDLRVLAYDPAYPYENPPWAVGDVGIVISKDGYYVFSVNTVTFTEESKGRGTLATRVEPVYYSGLLDIDDRYRDFMLSGDGKTGDQVTYPKESPVIRLSSFSMYLFREITNPYGPNTRQFLRVTDTKGNGNPLGEDVDAELSIMSQSIYDMQISYITWSKADFTAVNRTTEVPDANHYFAGGTTNTSFTSLMAEMQSLRLKEVDVEMAVLTDEYGVRGGINDTVNLQIPVMGDEGGYTVLDAKFTYRLLEFSALPRNYAYSPFQN